MNLKIAWEGTLCCQLQINVVDEGRGCSTDRSMCNSSVLRKDRCIRQCLASCCTYP